MELLSGYNRHATKCRTSKKPITKASCRTLENHMGRNNNDSYQENATNKSHKRTGYALKKIRERNARNASVGYSRWQCLIEI